MLIGIGIILMKILVLKYLSQWNGWLRGCGGSGQQDLLGLGSTVTREITGLGKDDEWMLKLEGDF